MHSRLHHRTSYRIPDGSKRWADRSTLLSPDGGLIMPHRPRPPLRDGRLEDAGDGVVERVVERLVALLGRESLGEGPGEAGDDTVVAGEPGVGLVAAVAARESNDTEHVRMLDELGVEVVSLRE